MTSDDAPHVAVHEARKALKKTRGLLRLVRGAFPGYAETNARLRDTARRISPLRDLTARIELCDSLDPTAASPEIQILRNRLDRTRSDALKEKLYGKAVGAACEDLDRLLEDCAGWRLTASGFEAYEHGLHATYKQLRKAMARVARTHAATDFHEWRKYVKYHRHHGRLLLSDHPGAVGRYIDATDDLGDLLGTHHDLSGILKLLPKGSGKLKKSLNGRRQAMEKDMLICGRALFDESPGALVRRWRASWEGLGQAGAA